MNFEQFYNLEHAQQYLQGSILRIEDEPVYIRGVGTDGHGHGGILYTRLAIDEDQKFILGTDDAINWKPVPLGMLQPHQKNRHVRRVHRQPRRQWKAGLTERNSVTTTVTDHSARYNPVGGILHHPSMVQCIKGDHMSLEEAMDSIKKGRLLSAAFHRRWSIANNGRAYYSLLVQPVGFWTNQGVDLFKRYDYLTEQLEKDTNE